MTRSATTPTRTCAGCREARPQSELVRLAVVDTPPFLVPDARRQLGGRGVWVMPKRHCLERAARKGGFARALRRKIQVDPNELADLLRSQLERRLAGLALGARRGGKIAVGTEAARDSLRSGRARAIWLATDGGRRESWQGDAERAGLPAIVGELDRQQLGALLGRATVAVAAIEDDGLVSAIQQVTQHLVGLREAPRRSNEEPTGQRIEDHDE